MGESTMLNRRNFLRNTLAIGVGVALFPDVVDAKARKQKLVIIHTNDMHSHFEPFAADDPKYANKGGMNRISAYMKRVKNSEPNVLLLDSGDFSQGTPYFNFYKAPLVFKMMTEMGYDASIVGNHEFDNGVEALSEGLDSAGFPVLSSNYDFSKNVLASKIKKNLIVERGGLKIGIYALCVSMEGLVGDVQRGKTTYNDPLPVALEQEKFLKNEANCDLIICLSHLGDKYEDNRICDFEIARKTKYTDLILGGHTHSFFEKPVTEINADNKPVIINQVGWAALMMGRIEINYTHGRSGFSFSSGNKFVDEI